MRLRTIAEGPAWLSRLSSAQAVLRPTPRARACSAVVRYPAAIKALCTSASFEACLAFAFNRKSANRLRTSSPCSYRAVIFSLIYSSIFRRTAGGRFCDERMRLRTIAEGPALLSRLSSAQAVLWPTPRARACWAFVRYPAAIKASRTSRASKPVSLSPPTANRRTACGPRSSFFSFPPSNTVRTSRKSNRHQHRVADNDNVCSSCHGNAA